MEYINFFVVVLKLFDITYKKSEDHIISTIFLTNCLFLKKKVAKNKEKYIKMSTFKSDILSMFQCFIVPHQHFNVSFFICVKCK